MINTVFLQTVWGVGCTSCVKCRAPLWGRAHMAHFNFFHKHLIWGKMVLLGRGKIDISMNCRCLLRSALSSLEPVPRTWRINSIFFIDLRNHSPRRCHLLWPSVFCLLCSWVSMWVKGTGRELYIAVMQPPTWGRIPSVRVLGNEEV